MKINSGIILFDKKEDTTLKEYIEENTPFLPTARRVYASSVAQDLVPSKAEPPQPTVAMQNYRDNMVFKENSRREFFDNLQRNQERIRSTMYANNRRR